MSKIEIIPTVVPASFDDIAALAARVGAYAPAIHVDIADGIFAPNTTWPYAKAGEYDASALMPFGIDMQLEVHLMVADPAGVGAACVRAGASRVIGHVEAMNHNAGDILEGWKSAGARQVGLGILFATPLETLDPYIPLVDVVQMMTIGSIGVQGLPFDERAPARVAQLHERHPELQISVDGGVSEATIGPLARAGARRFCAGSVLSKSADPTSTYRQLRTIAESALQ